GVDGDIGADGSGEDDGHRDVGPTQLRVEALGEELDGRLARSVGGLPRDRDEAAHTGDVDDARFRAGEQIGQRRLGRVDDAPEVHAHDPVDLGQVEVVEGHELLDDPGDVEETVDLPVGRDDLGEGAGDVVATAHVDGVHAEPT